MLLVLVPSIHVIGALACFFFFFVASAVSGNDEAEAACTHPYNNKYTDGQCAGIKAIRPQCQSPEAAYSRDYFYIGGRYQLDAALQQNILVDQMYVEKLTPSRGATKPHPIVLFTAGVPSGAVCAAHYKSMVESLRFQP